jgi:hypothetical protein
MSEDPMLFVRGMNLGKPPDEWTFSEYPAEAEWNLFRYCNNDPLDCVDPDGQWAFILPLLGKIILDEIIDRTLDKVREKIPEKDRETFDNARKVYDFVPKPKKIVKNLGAKSLSSMKKALRKVHERVGKLPKGKPGKFGSPQRGNSEKGYRLDPAHPDRPEGHPESKPHVNWWDYSQGKRNRGGIDGAEPIDE